MAAAFLGALGAALAAGALLGRMTVPIATPANAPSATAGVPGPGPRSMAAGVPVGYDRSATGAAQAAGNYLVALGQLDPLRAMAALDQVAEPSSRARLEEGQRSSLQLAEDLWGVESAARQGKRVVLIQTPVAYRVDSFTPEEASVRVWVVTSVGVEDRQRLSAYWGIGSVTLTWLDGDWRLRGVDAGSQARDVVPAAPQTPTATGGVPTMLDGFTPYGG